MAYNKRQAIERRYESDNYKPYNAGWYDKETVNDYIDNGAQSSVINNSGYTERQKTKRAQSYIDQRRNRALGVATDYLENVNGYLKSGKYNERTRSALVKQSDDIANYLKRYKDDLDENTLNELNSAMKQAKEYLKPVVAPQPSYKGYNNAADMLADITNRKAAMPGTLEPDDNFIDRTAKMNNVLAQTAALDEYREYLKWQEQYSPQRAREILYADPTRTNEYDKAAQLSEFINGGGSLDGLSESDKDKIETILTKWSQNKVNKDYMGRVNSQQTTMPVYDDQTYNDIPVQEEKLEPLRASNNQLTAAAQTIANNRRIEKINAIKETDQDAVSRYWTEFNNDRKKLGDAYLAAYASEDEGLLYGYIKETEGEQAADTYMNRLKGELRNRKAAHQIRTTQSTLEDIAKTITDAMAVTKSQQAKHELPAEMQKGYEQYAIPQMQNTGREVARGIGNLYEQLKANANTIVGSFASPITYLPGLGETRKNVAESLAYSNAIKAANAQEVAGDSKVARILWEGTSSGIENVVEAAAAGKIADSIGLTAVDPSLIGREGTLAYDGLLAQEKAREDFISVFVTLGMSSGATMTAVEEGKAKGYSADEAAIRGLISGAIEFMTEKVGMDGVFKAVGEGRGALMAILKSGLAEGSEELVGNNLDRLATAIADAVTKKDVSEYRQKVIDYIKQGMSESEAMQKVMLDYVDEDVEAFASAFFSAGMSAAGMGALTGNDIRTYVNEHIDEIIDSNNNVVDKEALQGLIETGMSDEFSKSTQRKAENLQKKLDEGKTITQQEVKNLYRENVRETSREDFVDMPYDQEEKEQTIEAVTEKLGEEGKRLATKAVNEMMSKGATGEQAFREFFNAYNAGTGNISAINTRFLSDNMQKNIFKAGWQDRANYAQEQQNLALNKALTPGVDRDANALRAAIHDGKVSMQTVNRIDSLAKAIGTRVMFHEASDRYNGQYNPNDGAIHLFLDSTFLGKDGAIDTDRVMMATFGHEFTHRLQSLSSKHYEALTQAVSNAMGAKAFGDAVNRAMRIDSRLTQAQATDEAVADFIGTKVFDGDSEFVDKLVDGITNSDLTTKEKKSALETIKDVIHKVRGWFMKTSNADKSNALRKVEDRITDILKAGEENLQSANVIETLNEEGVYATENMVAKDSLKTWNATDIEALTENLIKAGYEEEQIKKWIKDVNGVAATVARNRARYDYDADEYQVALKPNQEYYYSLDLSTLCKKRQLYQGTYNAIMHRLGNVALLPENTIALRNLMDKKGYEVPCGICFEESRKKNEGKFAERWLNGYGKKWKGYKNTQHDDPYIPTLNQVTTTDGRAWLRQNHPEALESYLNYQKTRGSANPKVSMTHTEYRGDILRMSDTDIENVKHIGGLRIQSFSDFETIHTIDMMQAVMDMASRNLTAQAYTKVPAFADIFGGTNIKINLSLIGEVDENGVLQFNDKEGMPQKEAFRLRDKYSQNVGTILVGANDASILAAWADPRIDMVIPFHRSGWSKAEFDKLGLEGYKDFTKGQTERYLMGKKDMALSTASKALGLTGDQKLVGIYSEDYWDYNKTGKENAEEYLRLCAEKHYRPVFYQFLHDNGDGSWSLQEDGSTDGYWKSLIDYKMYDNEGKGAPQQEVVPNFDMKAARKNMKAYDGNPNTLPVAQDVVDEFVKQKQGTTAKGLENVKADENGYKYSIKITDKELIDFLENQEHIKTYKAMQVIDGKLYPPMAARAKGADGKYHMVPNSTLGAWQQAVEDLGNAKFKPNGQAYYVLDKADGTTVEAAYNPYEHSSNLVLNDQFESAHRRDNLVVVEGEIPVSEMNGTYKADHAKDATGEMDWKSGVVASQLKDNPRKVYLSRYFKPVRILSDAEVAQKWADVLKGRDVAVPFNVVTPSLLAELEKQGIVIDREGSPMYKSLQKRAAEKAAKNGVRNSTKDTAYLDAVNNGDMATAQKMVDEAAKEAGYNMTGYHGSPNNTFTVFDGKNNSQFGSYKFGKYNVNYFTTSKENAESFSTRKDWTKAGARRFYLKVQNPYRVGNTTEETRSSFNISDKKIQGYEAELFKNAVKEFYNIFEIDEANEILMPFGMEVREDSGEYQVFKLGNNSAFGADQMIAYGDDINDMLTDEDTIESLEEEVIWDEDKWYSTDNIVKIVLAMNENEGTNYDAVIFDDIFDSASMFGENATDIVTLDSPNQIKSADPVTYDDNGNVIPLSERFNESNQDIRYSTKDSDGKTLTPAQQEYFKDSKVRDEDGNLMVMYHGTRADFTVFDPNVKPVNGRLLGDGFYFTDSRKTAIAWTKGHGKAIKAYLNITNPFVVSDTMPVPQELIDAVDNSPLSKKDFAVYKGAPSILEKAKTSTALFQTFADNVFGESSTEVLKGFGYDGIIMRASENSDFNKISGDQWVVFDSNQIKKTTNKNPTENPDIRYSVKDSYGFYSQLENVLEDYKGDKIGAASVNSYLKGKGVKDEEIKWSGIDTFLEGKKSVNKNDLLQYVRDNEFQIEEKTLEDITENKWFKELESKLEEYDINMEDIVEPMDETISPIMLEDELTWKLDDEEITQDEADELMAICNRVAFEQETGTRWGEWKLNGGTNYREVLFQIPGSDYKNAAMQTHWGGETGVLAHARLQDFVHDDGGKILFIEEIQSDWHNAGQKEGYLPDKKDIKAELREVDYGYALFVDGKPSGSGANRATVNAHGKEQIKQELLDQYLRLESRIKPPAAPFKNNYTDFVLKSLLRMAAEGNYDYLAWTTSQIQRERWSDEFAEGYRIEYDQDIPKFLKKYVKQWNSSLTEVTVREPEYDNEWDVQAVPITPAMREGIQTKGQPRFSRKTTLPQIDYDTAMQLQEMNKALREEVNDLKDQFKRKPIDVKDFTNRITKTIREYQGTVSSKEIIDELLPAARKFVQNPGKANDEKMYEAIQGAAQKIVSTALAEDEFSEAKQVRDFLKGKRIKISPTIKSDFGDWMRDYHRKYFGNIFFTTDKGTSVEDTYSELRSYFGEAMFPEYIQNPSDQLERILEVWEAGENIYSNPYDGMTADAIESVTYALMADVMDTSVKHTFADKQYEKREQLRKDLQEKSAQRIAALRADKNQKYEDLKQHYRDLAEKRREAKLEREDRRKLLTIANRLEKMKTTQANREVIQSLIGDLDTVAMSITGKGFTNLQHLREWYYNAMDSDPDFQRDTNIENAIERLEKRHINGVVNPLGTYKTLREAKQAEKAYDGDGKVTISKNQKTGYYTVNARENVMTIEDVRELLDVLKFVENVIQTSRHLIDSPDMRDTFELAQQIIYDVQTSAGTNGVLGEFDKYIVQGTLSPERAVRRYTGYSDNDPLYIATKNLSKGQRDMLDYQYRANQMFLKYTSDTKFMDEITGEKATALKYTAKDLYGNDVEFAITPAMRISLYLHSLNPQNMRHIVRGGLTVPGWNDYVKGNLERAYGQNSVTVRLTPSQVKHIVTQMSSKEFALASMVHDYFNVMSQNEINAVSEKLRGYSLAQVKDYFPIDTDKNFLNADFGKMKEDGTVEGMGFLKERIDAANAIMLRDVTSVLTKSIDATSKYVGLAIPVSNMNKLINAKSGTYDEKTGKWTTVTTVKKALEAKWGKKSNSYLDKMLTDVQNPQDTQTDFDKLFSKVRSNYAAAVLTLNLSVAMKQAASYPTAAAVVGWKPLVQAMTQFGSVDLDLIAKYTPLQWYRTQGYSTQELGDIKSRGKLMSNLPKALNWIQAVDLATTRKLWKAAEIYVSDNNKTLIKGSDAYYREVADIYNQIIEETQPNYMAMQRPELLRSNSAFTQAITMFKTQPFQNFNITFDAIANYMAKRKANINLNTEESQKEFNQAKKRLSWAVTSQVAQLATFAAMTFLWNALRGKWKKYKDEEDNLTAGSISAGIAKDMATSLFSEVPLGAEAWQFISSKLFGDTYYGFDSVSVSALNDMVDAFNKASTAIQNFVKDEKDLNSTRLALDSAMKSITKVFGIPYENVENLFNLGFMNVATRLAPALGSNKYEGQLAYLRLTTDPNKYKSDYYDNLIAAYESGDKKAYEELYDDMAKMDAFGEEKLTAKMDEYLKEKYNLKVTPSKYNMEPEELQKISDALVANDANENGSFSGDEIYNALMSLALSKSEQEAVWEAEYVKGKENRTTWDEFVAQKEKEQAKADALANALDKASITEAEYEAFLETVGDMNQENMYNALKNSKYTSSQKKALWDMQGWKTSYDAYVKKQNKSTQKTQKKETKKEEVKEEPKEEAPQNEGYVSVNSSWINGIEYDVNTGTLYVHTNRGTYERSCDYDTYVAFKNADSPGSFYNSHFR